MSLALIFQRHEHRPNLLFGFAKFLLCLSQGLPAFRKHRFGRCALLLGDRQHLSRLGTHEITAQVEQQEPHQEREKGLQVDVGIEAAWGGPMDVTGRHQPSFGALPGGAVRYGVGYTGGGVGPCHLGGKILAGLTLGIDDEHTALALVGMPMQRFPPEPLLSMGAALMQHAIVRKDEAEDVGMQPDPLTDFIARLPRRMGYELGP